MISSRPLTPLLLVFMIATIGCQARHASSVAADNDVSPWPDQEESSLATFSREDLQSAYDQARQEANATDLMMVELGTVDDGTSPCQGSIEQRWIFATGDADANDFFVVTAIPMPMNGPCELIWETKRQAFSEISTVLIGSKSLADIGGFARIALSPAEAIAKARARYPALTSVTYVKLAGILNPQIWDHPWYVAEGPACGGRGSAYIRADSGEILEEGAGVPDCH